LFLHDNAGLHKAADIHFEFLKNLAYSHDLAPSEYYLFPNLKKHLKGTKFSSTEEITLTVDGRFAGQQNEFFLHELKNLQQRIHNCVELKGVGEYRVNRFFKSHTCFLYKDKNLAAHYE
jgi:hypothetical protein